MPLFDYLVDARCGCGHDDRVRQSFSLARPVVVPQSTVAPISQFFVPINSKRMRSPIKMKSRTPCSTLFALKASLLTLLTLAGLSAASLWADTVYVQCGISTYYNGYSDSAPSHTSSTGGFAGTATHKSTATGMVSDRSERAHV